METTDQLSILHVDLMKEQNSTAHHTSDFDTNKLVVRRGQDFLIRVLFNHTLKSKDNLELQLSTGPNPAITNETLVNLHLRKTLIANEWSASIQEETGSEIIVAINSSPKAVVGKYSLKIFSGHQEINLPEKYNFYLLFNPWCKEDAVFMPNEEERAEYILNDLGYVYMGDFVNIQEKPWNFGQFEENVLDCCFLLLSKSLLKARHTSHPVMVTRAMSAMMNIQDDNGVLIGNWSGDYEGGVAPYMWTGSAPILQQYYASKQPVCFGQCWVFSGILTTVLRALGIPARSVTAYQSAHDTEKNLTVDIYMDENGKVSKMTHDSVWNFHVWTEVWMKRKDLPYGYDGWQVVDGTPQERSSGVYCCGPSPVTAIRKGEIFIGYDTKFIFSEVNADKVTWLMKIENGKKELKKIGVDTRNVGRKISTKAVGQDARRDITNEYKFPEGSSEEREVMKHALSLLDMERRPYKPEELETFKISVRTEPVLLGEPVKITVILRRNKATSQTADIFSSFDLQSYTGSGNEHVTVLVNSILMKNEVTEFTMTLKPDTYMKKLINFGDVPVIKGTLVAEVLDSTLADSTQVFVHFKYPMISIKMPDKVRVRQPLTCTCTIQNVLGIPLTNARFCSESLGLSPRQYINKGVVEPHSSASIYIRCMPMKVGVKKFIIKFSSNEVKEITAEKVVVITH